MMHTCSIWLMTAWHILHCLIALCTKAVAGNLHCSSPIWSPTKELSLVWPIEILPAQSDQHNGSNHNLDESTVSSVWKERGVSANMLHKGMLQGSVLLVACSLACNLG